MIEAHALHVRAGTFSVEDVSFSAPEGTMLALLGPSGAGKTLVVETLLGLRRPERGRILMAGRDVTSWPPEERGVSYLPQDVALFPHLSVWENILFGTRTRRLRANWEVEAKRLAERLQIAHLLGRVDVRSLSGGEAQRVALARALIVRPSLLCLDESFSALDISLRRQLALEFRDLQHELGLTVVLVTHDQEEAFRLATQVVVLMRGRKAQAGSPSDIFRRPASATVASFLGIENVWPVDSFETGDGYGTCTVGGLRMLVAPAPVERPTHLGIAGSEIVLSLEKDSTELNAFICTVTAVADLGVRWSVRLRVEGTPGLTAECSTDARTHRELRLSEGTKVTAIFPPEIPRCIAEHE